MIFIKNITKLSFFNSFENVIFVTSTLYQMDTKILIIGACGQIGTELTAKLRATYGVNNVIASDIRKLNNDVVNNGIFEVINGENLQNIINYASGFTENAYKNRILVKQKTNTELKVTDLNETTFGAYVPKAGDLISVDKILDRYENRVQIKGAVFRPGEYSLPLTGTMTIKDLVLKADGVAENVFLSKASLIRQKEDLTKEYISFNLKAALNGESGSNMTLQKEDIVMVFYNQELLDSYQVSIGGEVRKPGSFNYVSGMTLYDLLLESEYFTELAASTVTVFRNKKDTEYNPKDQEKIVSFNLTIDPKNPDSAAQTAQFVVLVDFEGFRDN